MCIVNRNSLFVHNKQIHATYAENIFYNNCASVRAKPAKSD
jgi:hypothetical protein